jgi:hypothetical protein
MNQQDINSRLLSFDKFLQKHREELVQKAKENPNHEYLLIEFNYIESVYELYLRDDVRRGLE